MPEFTLAPDEARDIAAYVLTTPARAARAARRRRRACRCSSGTVSYDEVSAKVFRRTCWHCHGEPDYAAGDGGPGNTGGFGFKPRGINFVDYGSVAAGRVDDKGERHSLFEKTRRRHAAPRSRALLARRDEEAGHPDAGGPRHAARLPVAHAGGRPARRELDRAGPAAVADGGPCVGVELRLLPCNPPLPKRRDPRQELALAGRRGRRRALPPARSDRRGRDGRGVARRARHAGHRRWRSSSSTPPTATTRRRCCARFELEARAAAQLKSPHVVQILDHGVDGRVAFIAMELLEGESLERRARARAAGSRPRRSRTCCARSRAGVERAHAAGIVHRDLKPANVFLARDRRASRSSRCSTSASPRCSAPRADAHLQTQAGFVVGTPAYMSPEQVLGQARRPPLGPLADGAHRLRVPHRPAALRRRDARPALHGRSAPRRMPVPGRRSTRGPVPPRRSTRGSRGRPAAIPRSASTSAGEMAEALAAVLAPGGVGESAIPTVATVGAPASRPARRAGRAAASAWSTRARRGWRGRRRTPAALIAGCCSRRARASSWRWRDRGC